MKRDADPFDLITRRTIAAVWHEAYTAVHGGVACLYEECPHSIDMTDLLEAITRISPQQVDVSGAPAALAN